MKTSGLDVLVGAAFSGLTLNMNGKAWSQESIFEDISQYVDTAREPPTGRLWVDCLIRPTLIVRQCERAELEYDYDFCSSTATSKCYPTSSQLATGNTLDTLHVT